MNQKHLFLLPLFWFFCFTLYADSAPCWTCQGTGKYNNLCLTCFGTGNQIQLQYYNYLGRMMPRSVYVRCLTCGGTGRQWGNCLVCKGLGVIFSSSIEGGGSGRNNNDTIRKSSPQPPPVSSTKCKLCNGYGQMFGGYSADYTGNAIKTWCDICNGDRDPHYHKKCISCNGTGYK
jgi:DnaJ-class molecular chaperone